MKKDIKTIIILLVLIVLLCGGIFFVVKSDVFSGKKDDVVENDKQNNEETKENEEENNEEELENQEKEDPEKQNEPKQEESKKEENKKPVETPKVEKPSISKVEVPVVKPVTNNSNNNNSNSGSGKEETPGGDSNNQGDSQGSNTQTPEPVKPNVPNGGVLTCKKTQNTEEVNISHIVVGTFDTTDAYIRTYKETYIFDYNTEVYGSFEDEDRLEIELGLKEYVMEVNAELASVFTFSSSSKGNVINVFIDSDYNRLKAFSSEDFSTDGFFYYDNFKAYYANDGYICS